MFSSMLEDAEERYYQYLDQMRQQQAENKDKEETKK